jgi:hypothetical protein
MPRTWLLELQSSQLQLLPQLQSSLELQLSQLQSSLHHRLDSKRFQMPGFVRKLDHQR